MTNHKMKELLKSSLDEISQNSNRFVIENELSILLKVFVNYIEQLTCFRTIYQIKKISIKSFEENFGLSYGCKRNDSEIDIADWLLDSDTKRSNNFLIVFIIAKESLLHFLNTNTSEIEEAFVNVMTFLMVNEIYSRNGFLLHHYSSIDQMFFPRTINGMSSIYFSSFITYFIYTKKSFRKVLEFYIRNSVDKSLKNKELFEEFYRWIDGDYFRNDFVAPFYMPKRLHSTLNSIIKLGCDNSDVNIIAKRLNVHPNTIRRDYKILLNKFNAHWKVIRNLDQLKLHKYFLRIIVKKASVLEKLTEIIWDKLLYTDRIFIGEMENSNKVLYCPAIFCPHLIAEKYNHQFMKFVNTGEIIDYTLREIRERIHYCTITTTPFIPTLDYFEKILNTNEQPKNFYSHKLSHEIDDFSLDIKEKTKYIDYNLLYYLSVVRGKHLLKSGRLVRNHYLLELFKRNNIATADVSSQNKLFNKLELRAKRRGLITYHLSMNSKLLRRVESTIFEIPILSGEENRIMSLFKQLSKFSLIGGLVLSDRLIGLITGISFKHPISKMIKTIFMKNGLDPTFYSLKLNKSRSYQFQNLYDYEEDKWII